jgi:hypothetical protein
MDIKSTRYRDGRDSILLNMFGRSPQTRIIDLFLDNIFFEFSRMEMIEILGMAKITMYKTIPLIMNSEIIIPSRKIGKTQLYRLNGDSSTVKHLRGIIRDISFKMAETALEDIQAQEPSRQDESIHMLEEETEKIPASSD